MRGSAWPADRRTNAQAHDELFDPDGFRQIIVCPGLEAIDLVGPAIARGQNQHRQMAAFLSPLAQNGSAGDFREAKIENGRIVGFGLAKMQPIFAIDGNVDGEILLTQGASDLLREKAIIFDQQNFHAFCVPCGALRLKELA
jgi:hypothetical protein